MPIEVTFPAALHRWSMKIVPLLRMPAWGRWVFLVLFLTCTALFVFREKWQSLPDGSQIRLVEVAYGKEFEVVGALSPSPWCNGDITGLAGKSRAQWRPLRESAPLPTTGTEFLH
jgi:hypothetical protein